MIITLCGDLQFSDTIRLIAIELTRNGYVALTPIDHEIRSEFDKLTEFEQIVICGVHLKRIDMADYILVVDGDGELETRTLREIAYAQLSSKQIMYMSALTNRAKTDAATVVSRLSNFFIRGGSSIKTMYDNLPVTYRQKSGTINLKQ